MDRRGQSETGEDRNGKEAIQLKHLAEKGSEITLARLQKECLEPLMGQSCRSSIENSGGQASNHQTGKSYNRHVALRPEVGTPAPRQNSSFGQ